MLLNYGVNYVGWPIKQETEMSRKAIYKHKRSGDLFAIETDDGGAFN